MRTAQSRALLCACTTYTDPRLLPLKAVRASLSFWAAALQKPQHGGYTVEALLDEDEHQVRRALARFLNGAAPGERLLIYLGCRARTDRRTYLCARDTERAELFGTGLPLRLLGELLQESGADNVLCLLDCRYEAGDGPTQADLQALSRAAGRTRVVVTTGRVPPPGPGPKDSPAGRRGWRDRDGPEPGASLIHLLLSAISTGELAITDDDARTLADLSAFFRGLPGQHRSGPLHVFGGQQERQAARRARPRRGAGWPAAAFLALALVLIGASYAPYWLPYWQEISARLARARARVMNGAGVPGPGAPPAAAPAPAPAPAPADPAAAPAELPPVSQSIETSPSGATVRYAGGEAVTPAVLLLARSPGPVVAHLSKDGFADEEVTLTPDAPRSYFIQLTPLKDPPRGKGREPGSLAGQGEGLRTWTEVNRFIDSDLDLRIRACCPGPRDCGQLLCEITVRGDGKVERIRTYLNPPQKEAEGCLREAVRSVKDLQFSPFAGPPQHFIRNYDFDAASGTPGPAQNK